MSETVGSRQDFNRGLAAAIVQRLSDHPPMQAKESQRLGK